jgi:hypothetical protein
MMSAQARRHSGLIAGPLRSTTAAQQRRSNSFSPHDGNLSVDHMLQIENLEEKRHQSG